MRKNRIHRDLLKERSTANFKPNGLVGQYSSRTTEIYTHVSTQSLLKIISPFDTL